MTDKQRVSARSSASSIILKSGRPPMRGLKRAHADAIAWLYKPHGQPVDSLFQNLEESFGIKREAVAYVFGSAWLLYMMIGGGAQFISNVIGFVYPAYASILAIRTETQDDDTQWLIYWTTFSSFFILDAFASVFLHVFPFYFIFKAAFLVYLWLPQTRGAQYLYRKYVDPAFTYIEKHYI